MTAEEKPLFRHDCDACVFLGRYAFNAKDGWFDLYYCGQGAGRHPTLIARWSDEGPDYTSGFEFGFERWLVNEWDPNPMAEAYRRAVEKKLELGRYQYCRKHDVKNGYRCVQCEREYFYSNGREAQNEEMT